MSDPAWTIMPTLAVRTTGFPIDLLAPLRMPRTAALVHELLGIERQIAEARTELGKESLPHAVREAARAAEPRPLLRLLSEWRRQVNRQRPLSPPLVAVSPELRQAVLSWNALIERHTALYAAAQCAWSEEFACIRAALWRIAADPRVLEAILISNPDVYRALNSARLQERTSSLRRLERSLTSYLQRLCTKNETNSFFGPINYGRLEPSAPRNVAFTRSAAPLRRRVTFAAQWMAEALASSMASDPVLRPFLRPRRGTRWRSLSRTCLQDTVTGRRMSLDEADAALFIAADGARTVAQLASTWTQLERLERDGVLTTRLLVPTDRPDPLQFLIEWLAPVPEQTPWRQSIQALQRDISCLASDAPPDRIERLAGIEAVFARVTGQDARRGMGAMYADRSLVFEECLGDLESFAFGGALARAIQHGLGPIFHMWHAAARLRAERDQRAARAVLGRARRGSDEPVPLLQFLAHARHTPEQTPDDGDRLDTLLADLRALVRARDDGHRARLRSSDLPHVDVPFESDACAFTSVDLLVQATSHAALESGEFQLVVGEAHAPPLVWVFPTAHFMDDAGYSFGADLHAAIGTPAAAQVALARDTKIYPLGLPGPTIELRPHYPDCRAISAASVDVRDEDGDIALWTDDRKLRLYPPLKRAGAADPFAALTFPAVEMLTIDLGPHTPRIEIDNVVYQRERWNAAGGSDLFQGRQPSPMRKQISPEGPPLPSEAMASAAAPGARDFELFLDAWRWKERLGLPDEVFVRFANEPKPVYLDLTNHFLIELFDHLARQNQDMTITEMLPSTNGTWLPGPGGRFSAEYRFVAVADSAGGQA